MRKLKKKLLNAKNKVNFNIFIIKKINKGKTFRTLDDFLIWMKPNLT